MKSMILISNVVLATLITATDITNAQGRFHAEPDNDGQVLFQRYETNPLWGQNFWCWVTNVSPTETVEILNLRIFDGKDGHQINKDGAPDPLTDCVDNGAVSLAPNQTCGVRGDPVHSGSKKVEPTAAHCVFYANGPVRGTLQARLKEPTKGNDVDIQLTAEAKPYREY